MSRFAYEDRLELLGILVGGFVVLYGLLLLGGTPWATNENTLAVVVQMLGILATMAVGVVLILIAYTGEIDYFQSDETDEE
jgi:hypothetical protein